MLLCTSPQGMRTPALIVTTSLSAHGAWHGGDDIAAVPKTNTSRQVQRMAQWLCGGHAKHLSARALANITVHACTTYVHLGAGSSDPGEISSKVEMPIPSNV